MKSVLFLLFGLLSLSASMQAHGATIEETLALCRAKGATLERLACYDELARAVAEGVSLPALPDVGIGKWIVDQELDPIDDTWEGFAMLLSEDFVRGLSGSALGVFCSGGGDFEVQIVLQGVRVAYPTGSYSISTCFARFCCFFYFASTFSHAWSFLETFF